MLMPHISRTCLMVACVESINGCGLSTLSNRETNPVVVDDPNNSSIWGGLNPPPFSTFSTTASRRMVIVSRIEDKIEVCSEPSPDVGEAFASAVADAIKLKAPIQGVPVEVSNQYARAVSTQIASLIFRTQGLQLYRDAMHNLCVDKMNKWFEFGEPNTDSYATLRKHYFDKSIELIKAELGGIKDVGTVKAGNNPDIEKVVDSTVKLLNASKPAPAAAGKPVESK
ncbi:MAG: hypothetical protein ABL925_14210 [Methylococcales bacterium]